MGLLSRLIRTWRTDDPLELAAQLATHQQDVDGALGRVRDGAWPRLSERVVSSGTHRVRLGELLLCETVAGDATVVLPESTGAAIGQVVGVSKLLAPGRVLVTSRSPIDGVQRDGAPQILNSIGVRLYVATTRGWQSLGGEDVFCVWPFAQDLATEYNNGDPFELQATPLVNSGCELVGGTAVRVAAPGWYDASASIRFRRNTTTNPASLTVALRCGTTEIGRDRAFRFSATTTQERVLSVVGRRIYVSDPGAEVFSFFSLEPNMISNGAGVYFLQVSRVR